MALKSLKLVSKNFLPFGMTVDQYNAYQHGERLAAQNGPELLAELKRLVALANANAGRLMWEEVQPAVELIAAVEAPYVQEEEA
jgi:hypothetical protein